MIDVDGFGSDIEIAEPDEGIGRIEAVLEEGAQTLEP